MQEARGARCHCRENFEVAIRAQPDRLDDSVVAQYSNTLPIEQVGRLHEKQGWLV